MGLEEGSVHQPEKAFLANAAKYDSQRLSYVLSCLRDRRFYRGVLPRGDEHPGIGRLSKKVK